MDDKNNIIVAGHRGYRSKYPENTLLSFQRALELGVDMIEFDVQHTRDKRVVVMHDDTLDRTTNGKGFVRDFTLEEIKSLDAGIWFSSKYKDLEVPTLEELLEMSAFNKKLLFNVEIKGKTHETVEHTVEILRKYGVLDRCVITCIDANILKYIWSTYRLKCQGFPGFHMENFEEGENGTYSFLYSVGISLDILTKELVDFVTMRNILPWPFCVNDEKWALKTIELGGTLVTCDDPVPALKVFKEKGYHK